jgi:HK97 family phage major capsid protein
MDKMEELLKALQDAQLAFETAKKTGDDVAKAHAARIDALTEQVKGLTDAGKATREELTDVLKKMSDLLNPNRPDAGGGVAKTLGELFTEADTFKNTNFANANASASANVGFIIKTLTTATAIPDKTRMSGIMPQHPDWNSWLFTRVAQGQMTGGVLEYVQDTTDYAQPAWPPNTPAVPENTLKPEVGFTFALKTISPKTIAHWTRASKQILADMSALRGFIDARLLYGLVRKLEWQVVNGDGAGANMHGLYPNAPDAGAVVAGDNPFDSVRKGIGAVESVGWSVDTIGLNPNDWALIQIAKDSTGRYLYFNPAGNTSFAPLWSKTVVPSPEVPAGKYLLGAFAVGAQLFEREGASVQAGFQNDDFVKNLVTILAEMRADLATYALSAFRKGSIY